jgi:hypothetical protein
MGPGEPKKPTEPVESTEPVELGGPKEMVETADPGEPVEMVETADPREPVEMAETVETVETGLRVKPVLSRSSSSNLPLSSRPGFHLDSKEALRLTLLLRRQAGFSLRPLSSSSLFQKERLQVGERLRCRNTPQAWSS